MDLGTPSKLLGLSLAAFACIVCRPSEARALSVVLGPMASEVVSIAEAFACCPFGGDVVSFYPTLLPFADLHRAEIAQEISETRYRFDRRAFTIDYDHVRSSRSVVHSSGTIYFIAADDTPYELFGSYVVIGDDRQRALEISLYDLSASDLVFEASETGSEPLSFDDAGSLQRGHQYRLTYFAGNGVDENGDPGAIATGSIELVFVPEPSARLLISTAMGVLAPLRYGWRRRSANSTRRSQGRPM